MFFTELAYAQDLGAGFDPKMLLGSPITMVVLMFAILYFLMIRPQQKRQKEYNAMLDALKVGDTVVTSGGFYGTITSVIDAQTFIVEIASGVKVKVARNGIAAKIDPNAAEKTQEKK